MGTVIIRARTRRSAINQFVRRFKKSTLTNVRLLKKMKPKKGMKAYLLTFRRRK